MTLEVVGRAGDTRIVSGVFRMTDTIGLPLDIIVEDLKERGLAMSVPHYIEESRAHGWTDKTISKRLTAQGVPEGPLTAAMKTAG